MATTAIHSTTSTTLSSVAHYTKLSELQPRTDVAILAVIAGVLPVKETKAKQYMTVLVLVDPSRPDSKRAFKLNLFRRTKEEIPLAHFREGNLIHIRPLHIQSYQGDVQGLCKTMDAVTLCILSFTSTSLPPTLYYPPTWSHADPFKEQDLDYARSLHQFWLGHSLEPSPAFLPYVAARVEQGMAPNTAVALAPASALPQTLLQMPENLRYQSLDTIVADTHFNLVCEIVDIFPFNENGTSITVTDFTSHTFPSSLSLENLGMYYVEDCVVEPRYLMDVQCWDEHHLRASTLRTGQIICLYNIHLRVTPKRIRLVLHGHQGPHRSYIVPLDASDPRWEKLQQRKTAFLCEESSSPTSSYIGVPYASTSDLLNPAYTHFRIRAQFLNLPPPVTWFHHYCYACHTRLHTPASHAACPKAQQTVLCEFQCTLKFFGHQMAVVCKEQGMLDFLGGQDLPIAYLDNPSLMEKLNQRVKPLNGTYRSKQCDVTIRRIPEDDVDEDQPRFQIIGTRLE